MKKIKAQKDILYVSISSFVLVAIWITSNIYHAHVTSTITPELQAQIEEVKPSFDMETIQKLKKRQNISPVYELDSVASDAAIQQPGTTGTPSPSTTPQVAVPSGFPERLGE